MILHITAIETIINEDSEKDLRSSPKANSATPLAPGVGLTNMNSHKTNCFPSNNKCSNEDSFIKD